MLETNDKVELIPRHDLEPRHQWWKDQEVGIGVVRRIDHDGWPWILWENGKEFAYPPYAIRKVEEAMEKKIEVPEQFLKDLYEIECVLDLKDAIEKHFGEVVKAEVSKMPGQVWIKNEAVYLTHSGWDPVKCLEGYRLMRSGTIAIKVRNGQMAGAEVQED